jgi:hypothetical protein
MSCHTSLHSRDAEPVYLPDSISDQYNTNQLPTNIQHEFGSEICHSLFADEAAVKNAARASSGDMSFDSQRPMNGKAFNSLCSSRRLILDPTAPRFQYDSLGMILRTNVVRGSGVTYSRGVTQTDFNAEVHKRRVGPSPMTQHRNRKDDLTKWAEQNIIMDRQRRAWDSHKAEKK